MKARSRLALAAALLAGCGSEQGRPAESDPGGGGGGGPLSAPMTFPYHSATGVAENSLSLDVYPQEGSDHPVVIFFHGGNMHAGQGGGDKRGVPPRFVALLARLGMVVVSPNFRLLGEVETTDAIVADGALAVGWVHQHIAAHGGDPERLVLFGYSAGAYSSSMLGVDPDFLEAAAVPRAAVRGVAAVDTVMYDIPRAVSTASERGYPDSAVNLPRIFGDDAAAQQAASVIQHIEPGAALAPFLIPYALEKDGLQQTLSEDQSQLLSQALEQNGGTATLYRGAGKNHLTLMGSVGVEGEEITQVVADFLRQVTQTGK